MPKKKEHSSAEHKKKCDEDIDKLLKEVEEKEGEHASEEEMPEEERTEEE